MFKHVPGEVRHNPSQNTKLTGKFTKALSSDPGAEGRSVEINSRRAGDGTLRAVHGIAKDLGTCCWSLKVTPQEQVWESIVVLRTLEQSVAMPKVIRQEEVSECEAEQIVAVPQIQEHALDIFKVTVLSSVVVGSF